MADVPKVPGVPPLTSYSAGPGSILMTADTVDGYGTGLVPAWGFYLNGRLAIICESVVAFGFRSEWAISKYPIERGGFESYDRVAQPFQCRLQIASGSTGAVRTALLASLDAASADQNMTKYDAVTPDVVYTGVSIEHVDYDRKAAQGAGLLMIDVWTQEIREQNNSPAPTAYPSGASTQSGGTVQPTQVPLPKADPRFTVS